ncbi:hypothetical protein FA13DRAFT_1737067 [Coprinellus micaceus]|uniref:Uncharacterized protein n=1 Tax=Coprinellus micaceus TaxID=71717 RepID=A0A4Y7SYD9_COPMI|nr:hypothetical protein FA13DRAFT_1737067 [Coprinellus micaceus]
MRWNMLEEWIRSVYLSSNRCFRYRKAQYMLERPPICAPLQSFQYSTSRKIQWM